jgi:hypothetical protein
MIKLSTLDPSLTTEELIDYLLDKKIYKIINDLTPKPNVVYELDELQQVWDLLKLSLIFK